VVHEVYQSEMEGAPFEGWALTGYDNITGRFWTVWMDTMSTAVYSGEGTCDEGHTTCTFEISGTDPMSGGVSRSRMVVEYVGENTERHSMFMIAEDGSETQLFEMLYERTLRGQVGREIQETA